MISDWWYDDGEPIWCEALKTYLNDGEKRQPAWHCKIYCTNPEIDLVIEWLKQNYVENQDYNEDYRFNSGNPALFVSLYNSEIATAFRLTWER